MGPAANIGKGAPIDEIEQVLSVVWPDEPRTLLLQACLGASPEANNAWHRFANYSGDSKPFFERDMSGLKGILPLVHSAARRNAFQLEPKVWTYLRSAALREELRYSAYRDLCGSVLRAFVDAGVPVIALKACALAETIYETPAERHCHAIDLLVPSESLADAEQIIRPLGFRPARIVEARRGARRGFRHESGLPLAVHGNLFDPPIYTFDAAPLWTASYPRTIAGVPVRVLCPTHNLLHVLGSAFHDPMRHNLRWACDAWQLLEGLTTSDWSELVQRTQQGGLEFPVLTMLRFLAGSIAAPVPGEVLTALEASAREAGRPSREAALSGAIGGLSILRKIWFERLHDPQARRSLLQFLLWPSAQFLQWRYGTKSRTLVALLYLYRPVISVAQRLWGRVLRLPGLNRFTHYHRVAAELERRRA